MLVNATTVQDLSIEDLLDLVTARRHTTHGTFVRKNVRGIDEEFPYKSIVGLSHADRLAAIDWLGAYLAVAGPDVSTQPELGEKMAEAFAALVGAMSDSPEFLYHAKAAMAHGVPWLTAKILAQIETAACPWVRQGCAEALAIAGLEAIPESLRAAAALSLCRMATAKFHATRGTTPDERRAAINAVGKLGPEKLGLNGVLEAIIAAAEPGELKKLCSEASLAQRALQLANPPPAEPTPEAK